ncbi:MAG: 30S ribosomal protein S8 [Candidatus Omnitrophica bacterium]|nr:30S ribosomal protein S8 [Candidatus Omnitrophota bacterium]
MSKTDSIADALTIIRNAARARHEETMIPYARILLSICEILKKEGYIDNYKEINVGGFRKIKVFLKYKGKTSVIREIKRVSRPGRRVYLAHQDIPPVLNGFGVGFVSTSRGLLTDGEAREQRIGGELLGMIW